jgi:hypothetical protein
VFFGHEDLSLKTVTLVSCGEITTALTFISSSNEIQLSSNSNKILLALKKQLQLAKNNNEDSTPIRTLEQV